MNTQNKVTKWAVIIGIVIVLNLFINYSLSLAYKSPKYEAFCHTTQVVTIPDNQAQCVSEGGQWTSDPSYGAKMAPAVAPDSSIRPSGWCDRDYSCRQGFDAANKSYNKNVFIALVLLGAIAVFLGNYFKGNDVISNGLALGGVLSFVIASMRYWGDANDLIRVVILAIALALLFYVAMKKFRNAGIQS